MDLCLDKNAELKIVFLTVDRSRAEVMKTLRSRHENVLNEGYAL